MVTAFGRGPTTKLVGGGGHCVTGFAFGRGGPNQSTACSLLGWVERKMGL